MAQDGLIMITQEEARLALEAFESYLSDNDTGLPEDQSKLIPYKKAMLSLGMSAGGWKPFSDLLPADRNTIIELKMGQGTGLAVQIRAPGGSGESTRLAYLSMQESGIDWVNPEDVDGWRVYDGQD
jgi:hypothetical protein